VNICTSYSSEDIMHHCLAMVVASFNLWRSSIKRSKSY